MLNKAYTFVGFVLVNGVISDMIATSNPLSLVQWSTRQVRGDKITLEFEVYDESNKKIAEDKGSCVGMLGDLARAELADAIAYQN